MEKMMKKPEVEAVRFEDADVIATSRPVTSGSGYATRGLEIKQYYSHTGNTGDSNNYSDNELYVGNNLQGDPDFGISFESNPVDTDTSYNYAWFNTTDARWWTEDKGVGMYDGKYPTGDYSTSGN